MRAVGAMAILALAAGAARGEEPDPIGHDFRAKRYGDAVRRAAVRPAAEDEAFWRVLATAACLGGDGAVLGEALGRLPPPERDLFREACLPSGSIVHDGPAARALVEWASGRVEPARAAAWELIARNRSLRVAWLLLRADACRADDLATARRAGQRLGISAPCDRERCDHLVEEILQAYLDGRYDRAGDLAAELRARCTPEELRWPPASPALEERRRLRDPLRAEPR